MVAHAVVLLFTCFLLYSASPGSSTSIFSLVDVIFYRSSVQGEQEVWHSRPVARPARGGAKIAKGKKHQIFEVIVFKKNGKLHVNCFGVVMVIREKR